MTETVAISMTASDLKTLAVICREHKTRVGKRATVPPGKTILDVVAEVALCERFSLGSNGDPTVEIGPKKNVKNGPQ